MNPDEPVVIMRILDQTYVLHDVPIGTWPEFWWHDGRQRLELTLGCIDQRREFPVHRPHTLLRCGVVHLCGQKGSTRVRLPHGGEDLVCREGSDGLSVAVDVTKRVHHPLEPHVVAPVHCVAARVLGIVRAEPRCVQESVDNRPVVTGRRRDGVGCGGRVYLRVHRYPNLR